MEHISFHFVVGMTLLVTNQPVGWGGAAFFARRAERTGKKIYYTVGAAVYLLSWGMLAAGAAMIGPHAAEFIRTAGPSWPWRLVFLVSVILLGGALYAKKKRKAPPAAPLCD